MIEPKHDRLVISFPEVHPKARLEIEFQRTLRIPDDDGTYPPDLQEEATKLVLQQAEVLCAEWAV